jgi:S-adenosylmethionine-diacylgycerolhomoserine-N-methlytransferase
MNRSVLADLLILRRMLQGRSKHGSHQQQLESFYREQAEHYDRFRHRLLHGRRELIEQLTIVPEQSIVELGGGTGFNLGFLEYPLQTYDSIDIVDLCPSLLNIAKSRYQHAGNVHPVLADASTYDPGKAVDRVYFSYALTMIPDWQRAIDNAVKMLKPGGRLGVVDFYVSDETVTDGGVQHGFLTRQFWRRWFAHDGVQLNPAHLRYLKTICRSVFVQESFGRVPYLPFIRAPYYIYVGQV